MSTRRSISVILLHNLLHRENGASRISKNKPFTHDCKRDRKTHYIYHYEKCANEDHATREGHPDDKATRTASPAGQPVLERRWRVRIGQGTEYTANEEAEQRRWLLRLAAGFK